MDGAEYLRGASAQQFDLIYADAWPGKFSHLDDALALLRPGGMYVIDDLLPQANWPMAMRRRWTPLSRTSSGATSSMP